MPEVKKILIPVVFSEFDTHAADYARQFAACSGAEVDLLHVTKSLDLFMGHEAAIQAVHTEFMGYEKEVAEKLMTAFAEKSLPGVKVGNKAVVRGNAADEILKYARENSIDMIVMPTHCRKGLNTIFVGSVTDRVVKNAPCPVLAVHPPSC